MGAKSDESCGFYIRMTLCAILIISFNIVIAANAFNLQVLKHNVLSKEAEKNINAEYKIPSMREDIYDRTKRRLLATTSSSPSLVFNARRKIEKREELSYTLSSLLSIPYNKIHKILSRTSGRPYIKRHISKKEEEIIKSFIKEKRLSEIEIVYEMKRTYPKGSLLGQVLGFVDIDNKGVSGIEKKYNKEIERPSFVLDVIRDARKKLIYENGLPSYSLLKGKSFILTFDEEIQQVAENELKNGIKTHNARSGIVIIMNPSNGEIYAMAHYPDFDPNSYQKYCGRYKIKKYPVNPCKIRATLDIFDPGSVAKIFTLASALESGVISLEDRVNAGNGECKIGIHHIKDVKKLEYPTVLEVIKYSSNCGIVEVMKKISKSYFYNTLKKFGFGQLTGIDLKEEKEGILPPPEEWKESRFLSMSYGYGFSSNALQITNAFSTIANGGVRMRPYLLSEVKDADGNIVFKNTPFSYGRVISERTSKLLIKAMQEVILTDGTGSKAAVEGFEVAGKTGTSKIYDEDEKKFVDRYRSIFVGFLPLKAPQFVIFVMVEEPKEVYYGGRVSAPIFKNIAERITKYMGIYPEEEAVDKSI